MTNYLPGDLNKLTSGNASRFIREQWLTSNKKVDLSAFDLRDIRPPETYVSFFLVTGNSKESCLNAANAKIQEIKSLKNKPGAIIVLEIDICLSEVNDDDMDIIYFRKEKAPHCGLYYLISDQQRIIEAKTTLCFLANERMRLLEDFSAATLQNTDGISTAIR